MSPTSAALTLPRSAGIELDHVERQNVLIARRAQLLDQPVTDFAVRAR